METIGFQGNLGSISVSKTCLSRFLGRFFGLNSGFMDTLYKIGKRKSLVLVFARISPHKVLENLKISLISSASEALFGVVFSQIIQFLDKRFFFLCHRVIGLAGLLFLQKLKF